MYGIPPYVPIERVHVPVHHVLDAADLVEHLAARA
jgi:hypothetical protein